MCKKLRTSGNVLLCFALRQQRANARPLKQALTRFGKSQVTTNRRFRNIDASNIYGRSQFIASDFVSLEA
jgi:hypothetical protein